MRVLLYLALIVWIFASVITHIVVCIKTASWLLLIAGVIAAPVAVIHGTGVWLGVW